ncbi:MAG: hypothetical protein FWD55_09030 [Propionibacteriaceae bacterium]|nr:hypothetical protein [Propionibacteriaceae bacterium]
MAHRMGVEDKGRETGSVLALTVADVAAMETPVKGLNAADCAQMAQSAMDSWGLCGVGIRRENQWIGVILIAPAEGIPRHHPISAGGIDSSTAGIIVVYVDPDFSLTAMGKRLCVSLCRHLRGQVAGIEAQASLSPLTATSLTPGSPWLVQMGFHPLRFPVRRYRLSFASLVDWFVDHLHWARAAIPLTRQPAPARRTV